MVFLKYMEEAMYTMTTFVGCMRPGEPLKARIDDLVKPSRNKGGPLKHWSITLAPHELGVSTKTQSFDDTIMLDHPEYFGDLLGAHVQGRAKSEPLFRVEPGSYYRLFKRIAKQLRLPDGAVPYQLRHAGASADLLEHRRTRAEVQSRGRWKCKESMARYAKPGKVQEYFNKLEDATQAFCLWADENLENILLKRVAARNFCA